MLQAEFKVIDNPIAVLHDRRTNLHITTAELDELQRVPPGLNTSYTADIHVFLDTCFVQERIACYFINHPERNRFDSFAGIAAHGLLLAYLRVGAHRDRLDGIDGADARCPRIKTGQCWRGHGHDIRGHFRNNRYIHSLFYI